MNRTIASLVGAAILSVVGTVAQAQVCEQCGGAPPPPPPPPVIVPTVPTPPVQVVIVCTMKGNAGIGNKGEGFGSELNDCDPGKSGLHNNAYKPDKPKHR